jgi:hypothetical protein
MLNSSTIINTKKIQQQNLKILTAIKSLWYVQVSGAYFLFSLVYDSSANQQFHCIESPCTERAKLKQIQDNQVMQ